MPEFHVEPCYNQNAANNYCGKEETRLEGPWEFGDLKKVGGDKKSLDPAWKNKTL